MYDREKWRKAVEFHGHECPGLAIGFKAVQALAEHFPAGAAQDEELVCVTENDTCAVDAVQSLLRCTIGKGNLIYNSLGKMAFNFYFRENNEALRIYFKHENHGLGREEYKEYLLNAPSDELFEFGKPTIPLPENARHFDSVVCEDCGEKVREDKIRLCKGRKLCLGCYKEYDR